MNHKKKMIAPVIITILVVLYYKGIAVLFTAIPDIAPGIVKIIIVGTSLLLSGIMVATFIGRIREIKGGEEDDLSKY